MNQKVAAWIAATTLLASGEALAQAEGSQGTMAGEGDIVVTGSRAANASINGLAVDPILLPQNVRVLDDTLIDRLGLVDLSQLYDLAGGMARQNGFGGAWDAYAIRGFSGDINQGPDLLVNRFTSNRGFNARRDVATVESFQVLKGPASALSGKGEPGGSINIVTKAPLDHFHASVNASYGSFDTWRGAFDFGGPVGGSGVATRVIGVYQESDGFRDFTRSDRLLIAPSIAWRASDSLRFLYQLEYNDAHITFDRGIPAVNGDAEALPRRRFLGEPNDGQTRQKSQQHQGTLYLDLAPGIAIEAGAQYRDGSFRGQAAHNAALVGTRLRRQFRITRYGWEDLSGRVELSANGNLGGIEHQFRVGGDAFDYDQRNRLFRFNPTAAIPYDIDIYNPVYGQSKPVAPLNTDTLQKLHGESVYAQDLLTLDDRFSLLLGVRHDWIRQTNLNYRTAPTAATKQSPSVTSPRAAFTFAPSDRVSAYVSWGRSFRFNQGTDFASNPFAPERGEAWEGGMKYALADKRLTGTVSLFRITKDNILVADLANSGFSLAVGSARSKGIEGDINYRLGDKLTLTAVYAYTDAKIIEDTRPAYRNSRLSNVPRHSGAIYGYWQSNGQRPGSVGLGAGANYVGSRAGDDVASGFRLDDYFTARADVSWQVTPALRLQVNAENLFDEVYSENSYSNLWVAPGAPRTVRVQVIVGL